MMTRVSGLWLYPVKSMRGYAVQSARLLRRGLEGDRRWMLVDEAGRFLTQREVPALFRFTARLEGSLLRLGHEGETLELPAELDSGERLRVRVWQDDTFGLEHREASGWVSERLGRPCRMVFMPEEAEREVEQKRGRPGEIVSFADGYPLLLISEGSLQALNARLAEPISMERFRPNLVVDAQEPHVEDGWARFRVGSVPMRGVKPCARCVMTTLDPETGEGGREPLKTLAGYRRSGTDVLFGMNVVHEAEGLLRVGDEVRVPG